jgi:hypothetical protein
VTFSGSMGVGCRIAGLTIQGETVGISCRDAMPTIQNCVVASPEGIAVEYWHNCSPELIDCTIVGRVEEGGDPGLVAYWRLDETQGMVAHDSEGEYDAMIVGVPLWQPEGGQIGGALLFDGADDYASAPVILDPAMGPISVFAWVKGGTPGQVILSQIGGTDWLMVVAHGCLKTDLKSAARGSKPLVSGAVIAEGNWHRVGLVWDGSNRSLYVNDVLVAEDTQQGLAACYGGVQIGCGKDAVPGTFWSGLIDDVRIYNRAVRP